MILTVLGILAILMILTVLRILAHSSSLVKKIGYAIVEISLPSVVCLDILILVSKIQNMFKFLCFYTIPYEIMQKIIHKGNHTITDLRYGGKYIISPSLLIFVPTKG